MTEKEKSIMYAVKELRTRGKGEHATNHWNQIGVMFRNTSADGKDDFSIQLDAHPVGTQLKAYEISPKQGKEGAKTGSGAEAVGK